MPLKSTICLAFKWKKLDMSIVNNYFRTLFDPQEGQTCNSYIVMGGWASRMSGATQGRPRSSGLNPKALVPGEGEAFRWKEMTKGTLTHISSLKRPPYLAKRGPGVEIGWGHLYFQTPLSSSCGFLTFSFSSHRVLLEKQEEYGHKWSQESWMVDNLQLFKALSLSLKVNGKKLHFQSVLQMSQKGTG